MPRTRGESIFFTAITAWMMVYCMTLYNTVLATGNFTNQTFLTALRGMWIEYVIIFSAGLFCVGTYGEVLRVPYCTARGSSDFYHFCHSDLYGSVAGGVCKHHWIISRIWVYSECNSGLHHDILQKFCHGASAAASYRRTVCPPDLSQYFYPGKRVKLQENFV